MGSMTTLLLSRLCRYWRHSTLVLRFTETLTNEIDRFVCQARRKPQRYPVVSRGFATQHGGQRHDFMSRFWNTALNYQRGQSAVEFLIIFPALIFLIFGVIQWALIYQARSTLNHAAFLAARAGAMNHGSEKSMKSALAAGLTPLFASKADPGGYVEARLRAEMEIFFGTATLEILNPTKLAMQDFGRDRLDGGSQKEIPNDTLIYRNPQPGSASRMSVQDANILHLRVTYCYRLIVPVVGRMIHAAANAWPFSETLQATGMSKPFGNINVPFVIDCANPLVKGPRIPIRTEAVVRMQSSFWESNL